MSKLYLSGYRGSWIPSQTFLVLAGIAMAGGLFTPAYAESCDSLKKQLLEANAKKKAAAAHAADLASRYKADPHGTAAQRLGIPRVILADVKTATKKTQKYEQRILAISQKTKNCQ